MPKEPKLEAYTDGSHYRRIVFDFDCVQGINKHAWDHDCTFSVAARRLYHIGRAAMLGKEPGKRLPEPPNERKKRTRSINLDSLCTRDLFFLVLEHGSTASEEFRRVIRAGIAEDPSQLKQYPENKFYETR